MNNKGFTLVELVATFALCSAIIFLLINVVLVIKNIYINYELKTNLIINQATLSNTLNEKIIDKEMITYSPCDSSGSCYIFYYNDYALKLFISNGTIKAYTYGTMEYIDSNKTTTADYEIPSESLEYNNNGNNIYYYLYKPYTYTNTRGSTIDTINVIDDENFIVIDIPIENKLFKGKNFGINLVYRK